MYNVYFHELTEAIKLLQEKVPSLVHFISINGNAYNDIIFNTEEGKFKVACCPRKVFRHVGSWREGGWVEV